MNGTARRLLDDRGFVGPAMPSVALMPGLLGSGGDARLDLDAATGLNRYGCSLLPRPAALSFSSSTASSLSRRALARAEAALTSWDQAARSRGAWAALDHRVEGLREEFCDRFGLCVSDVDIVFSSSGTDSQLHALSAVRARFGTPLVSIVVAADETGSGTVFTAAGRHFGERAAHGRACIKGAKIEGFEGVDDAIAIPARGPDGPRSIAAIDDDVLRAVEAARREGRRVLLQAMDCSKLGGRYPSEACLDLLRERWRGTVQIVLDACQLRLGRRRLRRHLDQGDMVLVTGSKFFTGPTFSGALLIPTWLNVMASEEAPWSSGLCDYASRQDWPSRLRTMRAALPARVALGPWLRWEAAMAEMEAYFAVPATFRHEALRLFEAAAADLIRAGSRRPAIVAERLAADEADEEFAVPTIFPFTIASGSRPITPHRAARFYADLNRDMGFALPASSGPAAVDLAARLVHIGQPVRLGDNGHETAALRVSADARFVIDCWSHDPVRSRQRIDDRLADLRAVFDKLDLLEAHDESASPLPTHALEKVQ